MQDNEIDQERCGAVLEVVKTRVKKPRRWRAVLLNDDYTPFDFVCALLVQRFHKDEREALRITQAVHQQGRGVAGLYPRDVCETLVALANDDAYQAGFPLKVISEPDE